MRASPNPRSEKRGKAVKAIGAARRPTPASARYQRIAARSEPPPSGSWKRAGSTSAFRSGRTGADTRRSPRGHFSHSFMVGGVSGIEAMSSARTFCAEKSFVLRKSRTRGWS